jgi:hypothetical protein
MTPSGIEPATFRFVAQYLNNCATAVPSVLVSEQNPSSHVAKFGHVGGRLVLRYYDLYLRLHLQFYVLLMIGVMESDFAVNKCLHTVTSCWILSI